MNRSVSTFLGADRIGKLSRDQAMPFSRACGLVMHEACPYHAIGNVCLLKVSRKTELSSDTVPWRVLRCNARSFVEDEPIGHCIMCTFISCVRFMERGLTSPSMFLQRRALVQMLLTDHAHLLSRVTPTSPPCLQTALTCSRIRPLQRSSRVLYSSAIGSHHKAGCCLVPTGSSLLHYRLRQGRQREPFLCFSWRNRAGLCTQAHSARSNVAQQQGFVHKYAALPEQRERCV